MPVRKVLRWGIDTLRQIDFGNSLDCSNLGYRDIVRSFADIDRFTARNICFALCRLDNGVCGYLG